MVRSNIRILFEIKGMLMKPNFFRSFHKNPYYNTIFCEMFHHTEEGRVVKTEPKVSLIIWMGPISKKELRAVFFKSCPNLSNIHFRRKTQFFKFYTYSQAIAQSDFFGLSIQSKSITHMWLKIQIWIQFSKWLDNPIQTQSNYFW